MDRKTIVDYFGGPYLDKPENDPYIHSEWLLLDKIHHESKVLDVGCGKNLFKQHFDFLIGIDPATEQADYCVFIEDFETKWKFDAILCLGSINFGTYDDIVKQVACVVNLLEDGGTIYWRLNPGRNDHGIPESDTIDFFPWDMDTVLKIADLFDCKVMEMKWDSNNRIYAEWKKR